MHIPYIVNACAALATRKDFTASMLLSLFRSHSRKKKVFIRLASRNYVSQVSVVLSDWRDGDRIIRDHCTFNAVRESTTSDGVRTLRGISSCTWGSRGHCSRPSTCERSSVMSTRKEFCNEKFDENQQHCLAPTSWACRTMSSHYVGGFCAEWKDSRPAQLRELARFRKLCKVSDAQVRQRRRRRRSRSLHTHCPYLFCFAHISRNGTNECVKISCQNVYFKLNRQTTSFYYRKYNNHHRNCKL